MDPTTIDLSYYSDPLKQEKKGTIDLLKVVKIHPSLPKLKEHAFAIETKDRRFGLKAPDMNTKNIWVAKLCELCGQGGCHLL